MFCVEDVHPQRQISAATRNLSTTSEKREGGDEGRIFNADWSSKYFISLKVQIKRFVFSVRNAFLQRKNTTVGAITRLLGRRSRMHLWAHELWQSDGVSLLYSSRDTEPQKLSLQMNEFTEAGTTCDATVWINVIPNTSGRSMIRLWRWRILLGDEMAEQGRSVNYLFYLRAEITIIMKEVGKCTTVMWWEMGHGYCIYCGQNGLS